jgi:HTH-type transcriptional regulator, competence development regulator
VGERFGQRIRRLRQERGLGLRHTAARAGMSATFLSRIENGEERTPPSEEKIGALSRVLGDEFDVLMTLAGRIPEEVERVITGDPTMPEFLRVARRRRASGQELLRMLERHINKEES